MCVAFDNSPLVWSPEDGPLFSADGRATIGIRELIEEWSRDFRPVLASGDVWLGGWHNPSTGAAEVNVTSVFDASREDFGAAFGALQDQESVYVIGDDRFVDTFGSGGGPWRPQSVAGVAP